MPWNASARTLFALLPILAAVLGGCIGGEETPVPTGPPRYEEAIIQGAPPERFLFDDVTMVPAGTVLKEMECQEGNTVFSVLPGCQERWRLTWNTTGFVPLGSGANGDQVGEVAYQIWLGESSQDKIIYSKHGDPVAALEGRIAGDTGWHRDNDQYVAVKITLEAKNDHVQGLTLLESPPFAEEEEEGEVAFGVLQPFEEAFGDAQVQATEGGGDSRVQISAFSLPETEGAYHAFLKTSRGDTYLATLQDDVASAARVATLVLPATDLAGVWRLYVSLENPDPAYEGAPSGFTVLTSRFSS